MIDKGSLVQSKKGHDLGRVYLVVDTDSTFAWCVDGNIRPINNPKKKRIKHLADLYIKNDEVLTKLANNKLHDFEVMTLIKNNKSIMHKD